MSHLIDIKEAKLHDALFLAGTNLQQKLETSKRSGLVMQYNRREKELLVSYKDETAILPTTNVASMTPRNQEDAFTAPARVRLAQEEQVMVPVTPAPRPTAQVDTPMSHVFAGPGHGKTGKDK